MLHMDSDMPMGDFYTTQSQTPYCSKSSLHNSIIWTQNYDHVNLKYTMKIAEGNVTLINDTFGY